MLERNIYRSEEGELPYYKSGEGGKVNLLLHGWSGLPSSLAYLDGYLNGRIIIPELPFHNNVQLEDITLLEMAKYFERFLKTLDVDSVNIYGFSVGGSVALKLASRNQLPITGLVVSDPYTNPSGKGIVRKAYDALVDSRNDWVQRNRFGLKALKESERIIISGKFWEKGIKLRLHPEDIPEDLKFLLLFGKDDRVVSLNEWYSSVSQQGKYVLMEFEGAHFWMKWNLFTWLKVVSCWLNAPPKNGK